MDFDSLTTEASKMTADLANEILASNHSPADKIKMLVTAITSVGETYASKLFGDISRVFGSENLKTNPDTGGRMQIYDLAQKLVRNSAFGMEAQELTRDYFTNVFSRNAEQAYKNAISLEKHPTITRQMTGRETCEWCRQRAGSWSATSFSDLPQEIFRRHLGCDCVIRLSGPGTRSYKLNNYVKGE